MNTICSNIMLCARNVRLPEVTGRQALKKKKKLEAGRVGALTS